LQSLLEKAKLSVVGWVADKELAISKAIGSVYPNVAFQHCQTHFLAAMKAPLANDDTEIGKTLKKKFGKIKPIERCIDTAFQAKELAECEKQVLENLCTMIRNWLTTSLSHKHRFKGLEVYDSLKEIKESIVILRKNKDHKILQTLEDKLVTCFSDLEVQYAALKQGKEILNQLTDLLYGAKDDKGDRETEIYKNSKDSKKVKEEVEHLLAESHESYKKHSTEMRGYLRHFQKSYQDWKTNLFTCYDHPEIPNDNNRLELSHSQMKKQYRRITGQKSTAQYLINHGEQAAFILDYTSNKGTQEDLVELLKQTDSIETKKQKKREKLKSQHRGRNTANRKTLTKTLAKIEQKWGWKQE